MQRIEVVVRRVSRSRFAPSDGKSLVIFRCRFPAQRLSNADERALDHHTLRAGNYVRIEVADTGAGVTPENLSRIFDPYFTTKQSGHGLGLATVYSIIRRHHGHIEAESEPGTGSTFRFWLPAAPDSPATASAPDKVPPKPEQLIHGRVLFMDDEEPIQRLAGRMLQRLGLTVEFALDGAEAVALYRRALESGRRFDLVVLDLTVPGKVGGREAIALLRELDPAVRAIVSSGYSSDPIVSNFKSYGFCGRVAKPYEVSEFIHVVRSVLAGETPAPSA